MKNVFVYAVVSVVGAAVLAMEILATRILGPFYGVDLFLWSALITVTLAALSLGYSLGGHWADKGATVARMCMFICFAGIWTIFIPVIMHPVLVLTHPLGLRGAVLLSAFVLFFPPLVLLGTVSPYAIKLRATSLDHVGKTAGNLYAVSTIASVFSALLTGFILIPNIGVSHLMLIIGSILVVTAIAGSVLEKRNGWFSGLGAIMLVAGMLSWNGTADKPDIQSGLLAVEQSTYGELRVLDTQDGRYLFVDGAIHNLVDTSTWNSNLHCMAVLDVPKYFFEKPGTMLLIGLGAGSLVKQYSRDGWKVEAVEIDPEVIRLAHEYFGLQLSDGNVVEKDGRQFVASTRNAYDVIVLDAFGGSSIPFHLLTREAFGLISSHLNQGGILALNLQAVGWNDPIIKTVAVTLKQVFNDVLALPMEEPPNRFGNIVLLASNKKLEPLREPEYNAALAAEWRYGPGYQKVHAWNNRFMPDISGARVLTDDLNPIDVQLKEINLAARRELHKYFDQSGISW